MNCESTWCSKPSASYACCPSIFLFIEQDDALRRILENGSDNPVRDIRLLQIGDVLIGQRDGERSGGIVEVLRLCRADNRCGDTLRPFPGQSNLLHLDAIALRQLIDALDNLHVFLLAPVVFAHGHTAVRPRRESERQVRRVRWLAARGLYGISETCICLQMGMSSRSSSR